MPGRFAARALYVVAAVLVAVGAIAAVRGWRSGESGPDDVVRSYFSALQRGEAATALGFGTVPAGSRALVTDAALQAQQEVAPLHQVVVLSSRTTGPRAVVRVGYALGFAAGPLSDTTSLGLHRTGGRWLLDASAIRTRFAFTAAGQRATIAGQRVPSGPALVFPGAVALRFDSPYLTGSPASSDLDFESPTVTRIRVSLTSAGRHTLADRVRAAVARCLRAGGDTACPQPDERYLPGSLRGRLDGRLHDVGVELTRSPLGTVRVQAEAGALVRFRLLNFTDGVDAGRGRVDLRIRALTPAARDQPVRWTS